LADAHGRIAGGQLQAGAPERPGQVGQGAGFDGCESGSGEHKLGAPLDIGPFGKNLPEREQASVAERVSGAGLAPLVAQGEPGPGYQRAPGADIGHDALELGPGQRHRHRHEQRWIFCERGRAEVRVENHVAGEPGKGKQVMPAGEAFPRMVAPPLAGKVGIAAKHESLGLLGYVQGDLRNRGQVQVGRPRLQLARDHPDGSALDAKLGAAVAAMAPGSGAGHGKIKERARAEHDRFAVRHGVPPPAHSHPHLRIRPAVCAHQPGVKGALERLVVGLGSADKALAERRKGHGRVPADILAVIMVEDNGRARLRLVDLVNKALPVGGVSVVAPLDPAPELLAAPVIAPRNLKAGLAPEPGAAVAAYTAY